MNTITLGLFQSQESAENAINELSTNGFSSRDIFIIMQDQEIAEKVCKTTGAHVGGESGSNTIPVGLIGLGLPEEELRIYEKHIKNGSILLGVPINDLSDSVNQILERHQASQIRSVNRNTA